MRVAIPTTGRDLEGVVDPRFGRASAFVIYDTTSGEWSLVDNTQNLNAAQGAGIQAATAVVNAGAEAVLTFNCGPKAFRALSAGKVAVYTGARGTVREAIEEFLSGSLPPAAQASVGEHAGMGL
jgi:predicted Fe-Mo cluster-binding NifX family protein